MIFIPLHEKMDGDALKPKKKYGDDVRPLKPYQIVKVTSMSHITEVQYLELRNMKQTIKKLNEKEYMVMETREIKEFQTKSDTRADNENSFAKTMRKLRNIIRNNFTGGPNELMLTLTYAENMRDVKILYADLEKFFKKLKYHHGHFEYLVVIEPQARGAWHAHILVKFPNPIVLDNNSKTWHYWGHGITTTKRLLGVDDIGAYLTAYLTDLSVEDAKKLHGTPCGEIIEKEHADGTKKKYIKGGRIHLYPANMKLFRSSKGIKLPESELMSYEKAKKKFSLEGMDPFRSENQFEVGPEKTQLVIYEQYNHKRKK